MKEHFKVALILLFCSNGVTSDEKNSTTEKNKKALSTFQVVSFPNYICYANDLTNQTGTCYLSFECAQRGGKNAASCANGFGVCCVFTRECGDAVFDNNTYFEGMTTKSGKCALSVCQGNMDVCRIRLDFIEFTIAGPSQDFTSSKYLRNGYDGFVNTRAPYKPVAVATQCLTDTFSIDSAGGFSPPAICGVNSGQHVYADNGRSLCSNLLFQFGSDNFKRKWMIKITLISCSDPNMAPSGCTQYFIGMTSGTVQSFNYEQGMFLAEQTQQICIRREIGYCKICWSPTTISDFQISGYGSKTWVQPITTNNKAVITMMNYDYTCYRNFGCQSDCVMVPGTDHLKNTFCGQKFASTKQFRNTITVCTVQTPFMISFFTDSVTNTNYYPNPLPTKGFRLAFWQLQC